MGLGSEELGECMLRQGAADPEQGAAMGIPTGTGELAPSVGPSAGMDAVLKAWAHAWFPCGQILLSCT